MILQSLVRYYETLEESREIPCPGWAGVKVSYALEIDEDGQLLNIFPLKTPSGDGKKMIPREMQLPERERKSADTTSCFLCDDRRYILNVPDDENEKSKEKAEKAFCDSKKRYEAILKDADSKTAWAILRFLDTWETQKKNKANEIAQIMPKENIVFFFDGQFAQDDLKMKKAWEDYYFSASTTTRKRCMVTGNMDSICRVHPGFNIPGGTNPKLVSFDEESVSFCSYGKDGMQGLNVPIGVIAAAKYGNALSFLLANSISNRNIADMKVVFWAENAKENYQKAFLTILNSDANTMTNEDLCCVVSAISQGKPIDYDGEQLDPQSHFFVLGLYASSKGRVGVRFFLQDSFGNILKHIKEHYDRLEIISDSHNKWNTIPLWALLSQTVNQKSRDKSPSPQMAGDTLRAILTGGQYPSTLYQQTQLRIRAERTITRERAAIIKAYLLRNTDNKKYKEALTVELNEQTTYQPYVLGRLFSVLEAIQQKANPGINATIKDKYFTSACATPAVVFPTLINLASKHMRKLETGSQIYYSKQLNELMDKLSQSYPAHLTLNDQGIFQLGYYHQTQKRFEKKTTENSEEVK